MRAGNSRVTNKKGILLVWIATFVLLPVKNSLWIKSLMDVRCSKLTVSHNLPFSQAGPDKLCETAAVLVSGRQ